LQKPVDLDRLCAVIKILRARGRWSSELSAWSRRALRCYWRKRGVTCSVASLDAARANGDAEEEDSPVEGPRD